jgi:hypothetical protein
MDQCTSYEIRNFEYLFPSPVVLTTMCLSHDRTELFIMSIVRLFIWIILYYLIIDIMDIESNASEYSFIKYMFHIIIGICIVYIGMVLAKSPVFSLGSGDTVTSFKNRIDYLSGPGSIPYELD